VGVPPGEVVGLVDVVVGLVDVVVVVVGLTVVVVVAVPGKH
jgi:hypothetical protein